MAIKMMDLVSMNKWWRGSGWEEEDPDLKRLSVDLERRLIEIKKGSITLIRGIRRSGKTV